MAMEKYLYFRKATSAAEDDDEVTGSTVYPLSSLRGICSGTATSRGVVTDDADAFSMFFTPKSMIGAGAAGDTDDAGADNVDVVVVAITTDNNQKAVIQDLLQKIQHMNDSKQEAFLTVFDAGAGGSAEKFNSDVEDITIIHNSPAD